MQGERTIRRGRPPNGGQDSDRVSYRCSAPYTLSRFAGLPLNGKREIGGTGYCVIYDTDSQSRNVLASPLGEEGHEVAKGCTRVRMIMTLDVDVTAERRHYNTHRPIGRYHNPRPERPSPPEQSEHNPSTQPAASAAPPNKKIINVYSIFPLNVIQ